MESGHKASSSESPPLLVVGIGNDILSDDGIGPRLIDALKIEDFPAPVEFQKGTLGGLEVLEMITGYSEVIFLDAIKTKGGIPGAVYLLTPETFIETLHLTNLHDINFLHALELGKKLDMPVPKKITIIAIEILEDLEFGIHFSPPVQQKYPGILEEIRTYIYDCCKGNED